MKIPVLLSDWTIGFGGARVCFVNLLERLDRERFQLHALVRDRHYLSLRIPGVRFHHFPYLLQYELQGRLRAATRLPGKVCTLLSLLLHYPIYVLPYFLYTAWILARYRIRIVHLNNWCIFNVPAMIAARLAGLKVLSHQREHADLRFVWKHRVSDAMIERHLAVSASVKRSLVKARIPEGKIQLLYDAIDPEAVARAGRAADPGHPAVDTSRANVGIFGRIVDWKGQYQAIQAVEIAARRHPNIKLYVVGDASDVGDEYLLRCKAYVEEKRLGEWVEFTGYMKNPYAFMSRMDVVLHNSTSPEPFGMVLVEGMALGRVVVAANLGGPAEIIRDGEDGFLVDPADPAAIAEKLSHAIAGAEGLERVREKARATVDARFSLARQTEEVGGLYETFARAGDAPRAAGGT
jgi:glycosyltransferase involved in cell wall biosynthesis